MKKNKEHKKGESTIGKIIYGFLLFMPLFAIGVTCGYAMINKNAYQSYSSNQNSNYELKTTNEIKENNVYNFSTNNDDLNAITKDFIEVKSINIITANITLPNNVNKFRIYYNPNNITYSLQFNGDTIEYQVISSSGSVITRNIEFSFVANTDIENTYTSIKWIEFGEQQALDNVFYYSVDKVTESPLFSWATNSVIYTTMNATCTQLSITTPFIPLLLSYWLISSVIYFLYDIALMLIWLLHDKIHEMRDSLA